MSGFKDLSSKSEMTQRWRFLCNLYFQGVFQACFNHVPLANNLFGYMKNIRGLEEVRKARYRLMAMLLDFEEK